jgi:localization factor PodJL
VKGIAPAAREAARKQATQRGQTLGEYLNALLLEEPATAAGIFDAQEPGGAQIVSLTRGDGGPDDIRRLSSEIDRLSQRLEASQVRSQRAMTGVDRSVIGLMGKVDATGKAQLQALERVAHALSDIEAAQTALRSRIDGIESDDGPGKSADALRSLESSLGRLAETVSQRTTTLEREQSEFRDLFDTKVSGVADRVDNFTRSIDSVVGDAVRRMEASILDAAETRTRGAQSELTGRIDDIDKKVSDTERKIDGALGRISDAASRFEQFENKAERAVTDSTSRMERALETSVNRSRQMSRDLLDRVESIEEKTRDAVGGLSDAMSRITERLARAERSSSSAVSQLERTVQDINDRVGRGASEEITQLKSAFEKRLNSLADDMARPMQGMRAEMERRLEEAMRASSPEKFDRIERSIRTLQDRLETSEGVQADAVENMSAQVERMSRAVDERLRAVESSPSGLTIDDVRRELQGLADSIDEKLADGLEMRISAQEMGSRELVRSLDDRFKKVDDARIKDLASVTEQVGEIAEKIQRRQDEGLQILQMRIDEAKLGDSQDFSGYADKFEERVRDSERRSAEAIVQIGEQVARVADRLANQHSDSLRSLESRLAESERLHETRLSDALSDMSRRLDELGDHTASALNPVHKTVSSIAQRLAAIEDGEIAPRDSARKPSSLAPLPEIPPALTAKPPAAPLDEFLVIDEFEDAFPKATSDEAIVGVEPPPFDRAVEARLFGEDPTPAAPPDEGEFDAPTDANEIDDLLDVDDVLLESPAPPPASDRYVAELPEPNERPGNDYLAEARRAALHGRRVTPALAPSRRGIGPVPVVASAALALAVAGGGYWTFMRGKQEVGTDGFAKADPAKPLQPSSDASAQAASTLLFGDAHPADATASPSPIADGSAAPTAAAERATAADLFEEGPSKGTASAKGGAHDPKGDSKPAVNAGPHAMKIEDAVAQGDPVALYDYANDLMQGADKARAISLLKEASGKGLVMAQYRLAKLYEKGEGVARDMAASRAWTEKAAIGGNVKAMHDLAVFFAEGDAGPQSYASAVQWFRQAADFGLVDSQFNLAVLYEQGLGVSKDPAEAAFWFQLAGRAGDADGVRRSNELLSAMDGSAAEQVRRRVKAWNPKAQTPRANGDFGKQPWAYATPDQVGETQRLLSRLGYSPGPADGRTTRTTIDAIKAFERDNRLPVTGDASVALLRQLKGAALNAGH